MSVAGLRPFLVDPVHESRRREGVLGANRGKLPSRESEKILVVQTLDMIPKEDYRLPV